MDKTEHGGFTDFERQNITVSSCERQPCFKFSKGCIPPHAVYNDLQIFKFPNTFTELIGLEKILLGKECFFQDESDINATRTITKYSSFIVYL